MVNEMCGFDEINKRANHSEHSQQSCVIMWTARANAPLVMWRQTREFLKSDAVWIRDTDRRQHDGKDPTRDNRRYPQRSTVAIMQTLFAIPNGGARDAITASRLKAEGVKPGVPDLFLPYPKVGRRVCGLFLEMKRPGSTKTGKRGKAIIDRAAGSTSDAQERWHATLRDAGYEIAVCMSFEEAVLACIRYIED